MQTKFSLAFGNDTYKRLWPVSLAALILAALACSMPMDEPTADASGIFYEDDFAGSNQIWDTVTDDEVNMAYSNEEYTIQVFADNLFTWGNPGKTFSDIHIEVTARFTGDAAGGIMCGYQDSDNYYYMGMSADGYYGIGKTLDGVDTMFTSSEDMWEATDLIEVYASDYRIGADCGQGKITLYVNGKTIGSIADDSFTSGDIGLFGATFDDPASISYDNLIVTKLQ
ncbi:MAG: hypothetical protein JXB07_02030 [Anaerolineae bacterium]|nr:hypothetical protein [Anaerolineae bacterium]